MDKSKLIRFVWKGGEKGGTDGVSRTFLREIDDRSLLQRLGQCADTAWSSLTDGRNG